jgi:hypothetical protein
MNSFEDDITLTIRPRPTENVSVKIPIDTLQSLNKIAQSKDMSLEALIKYYVGQGLRQDISKIFAEQLMNKTAEVLARYINSEEEICQILEEIKSETRSY